MTMTMTMTIITCNANATCTTALTNSPKWTVSSEYNTTNITIITADSDTHEV